MTTSKTKTLLNNLGPGLLFACMAIGTSHLVLSTKAGAQYGFIMIIPIILANVFKYPFFEFGIRYTNITNKTLIEGYLNRGSSYLWFYTIITLTTIFTILAALYTVTAGLFINLFQILELNIIKVSLGLFILISGLLIIGKYKLLELSLKLIVSILFFALIITTVLVIFNGKVPYATNFVSPTIFNEAGILFLIGLMGWMPTTVEASSWVSLWSIEKFKITANKPSLKEALLEFKVGYFLTAIFAVFFLIIGWMTLYGTNTILSNSAIVFADQLVNLFTTNIGAWAYLLIAIAAFSTMFSTCITAHDALARVSIDIIHLISPKINKKRQKNFYPYAILILTIINFIVISVFSANMGQLIAIATFISFVVAPFIGYMNYKNVMSDEIPIQNRPKKGLLFLTFMGIIFLSLFSIYYFYIVLF
tara:strand:- start:1840 stop:3099 length:1260 start_codon:yes stop_codon:yes gene_type:complete